MLTLLTLATLLTQDSMVTIPKSMLTVDQKVRVEQTAMTDKIRTYGNWVGIGNEIGSAVNSSLSAISDNANKFAQTPVGKATIYLVIWKVIGKEILGFFMGTLVLFVGIPLTWRSFVRRIKLLETEPKPSYGNYGYGEIAFAHGVYGLVLVGIAALCFFAP